MPPINVPQIPKIWIFNLIQLLQLASAGKNNCDNTTEIKNSENDRAKAPNIFISSACLNICAFTSTSQLIINKNANGINDFKVSLIDSSASTANTGHDNKLNNRPTANIAQKVCKNRADLFKAFNTK
jgi:hypothetical protein